MFYFHQIAIFLTFFSILCGKMMAQTEAVTSALYNQPQPKHEVRAVWLTTLNGLDWPRTKANDAAGIERQKAELVDILNRLQRSGAGT